MLNSNTILLKLPPDLCERLDLHVQLECEKYFRSRAGKKLPPVVLSAEVLNYARQLANQQGIRAANRYLREQERLLRKEQRVDRRLLEHRPPSRTSVVTAIIMKALENHNNSH